MTAKNKYAHPTEMSRAIVRQIVGVALEDVPEQRECESSDSNGEPDPFELELKARHGHRLSRESRFHPQHIETPRWHLYLQHGHAECDAKHESAEVRGVSHGGCIDHKNDIHI